MHPEVVDSRLLVDTPLHLEVVDSRHLVGMLLHPEVVDSHHLVGMLLHPEVVDTLHLPDMARLTLFYTKKRINFKNVQNSFSKATWHKMTFL